MAAKHTPAPLEVGYYHPTAVFRGITEHVAVMKPDGSLVAITGSTRSEEREVSEADAHLYAAAPVLLEVLKTTLGNLRSLKGNSFRQVDTIDEWIAAVEGAIAKAEGRS